MGMSEREHHIKVLENLLSHYKAREKCEGYYDSTLKDNVEALQYAISSLKTDEAYQLMYEGEEIYTKDDLVTMLEELKAEIEEKASAEGDWIFAEGEMSCAKLTQQKIDSLKGVEKMGTSNAFLKVRTFVKNCPVSIIGNDSTVMVARLVDNELWYYGLYDTWERANEVAQELRNGVVFEIDSLEGNK